MNESTTPPRIFISYSHDSDNHREFVRQLANRLRGDGLDCRIDQYINGFPEAGWQRWMEDQVEQVDYVLIVCTPAYLQRFRGKSSTGGRGVNFEGVVISQTLYDHYYRNTKFIPLIPEGGKLEDVPLPLKNYSTFSIPGDYEQLYRFLTQQHATPAPDIGEKVILEETPTAKDKTRKPETGLNNSAAKEEVPQTALKHKTGKQAMSHTIKAAYIGAAAALLAALIAGLFTLFSQPEINTKGDCAGVITGDINASVNLDCDKGD